MNAKIKITVSVVTTVTATIAIAAITQQGFAWTPPGSTPPNASPAISVSATGVGIGTATPAAKLEVSGSSLGSTANSVVEIQRFRGLNSNVNSIDIRNIRTSAGTDWNTAGARIQEKVDATWMGYIQFNGNSNNGGISFGTGLTTTAPGNVGERMRINATGNVGIGTASPDSNYKLTTSGGGVKAENASATQPAGYFNNTGGGPAITVGTGGISLGGVIQTAWPAGMGGAGTANYIPKFIAGTTIGNSQIFDSGTNVGIGTTAPGSLLHVSGTTDASLTSHGVVMIGDSNTNNIIIDQNEIMARANGVAAPLYINNDGGNVLLGGTGNIGIGVGTPQAKFHVNVGVNQNIGFSSSASEARISTFNDAVTAQVPLRFEATEFNFLNGNVGIGTATPGGALDVNGRAAAQSVKVASTFADLVNNAPWYGIGYTNLTLSGAGGPAVQAAGYNGLNFQTAGGQMVLNHAGNVGIGTTNPTQRLVVNGNIVADRFTDSASAAHYIDPASTSRVQSLIVDTALPSATTFEIGPIMGHDTNQAFDCPAGYVLTGMRGGGDEAFGGEVEFVYGKCTSLF